MDLSSRVLAWLKSTTGAALDPDAIVERQSPPPQSHTPNMPDMPETENTHAGDGPALEETPRPPRPPRPAIRNQEDLYRLEKPIQVVSLTLENNHLLPSDVHSLYKNVFGVVNERQYMPMHVRDAFKHLASSFFAQPSDENPCPLPFRDPGLAADELRDMRRINNAAGKSQERKRHEHAWNVEVHGPLLRLAHGRATYMLDPAMGNSQTTVESECVTTASVVKDCIPRLAADSSSDASSLLAMTLASTTGSGSSVTSGSPCPTPKRRKRLLSYSYQTTNHNSSGTSTSKRVDFVLALYAEETSCLHKALERAVLQRSFNEDTLATHINQIAYHPVRLAPIGICFETKIEHSGADPLVQLGLFAAAWHRRMASFARDAGRLGPNEACPSIVTLPVVTIRNHEWKLYYVVDGGDKILVYGPQTLGSTESLQDQYQLLASLGHLYDWVAGPFRKWIESWFQVNTELGI